MLNVLCEVKLNVLGQKRTYNGFQGAWFRPSEAFLTVRSETDV